jgi:hypothetical protein
MQLYQHVCVGVCICFDAENTIITLQIMLIFTFPDFDLFEISKRKTGKKIKYASASLIRIRKKKQNS